MKPETLVPALFGLQFAVFGWRINREIAVEARGERTWLLVCDYINFISMLSVLAGCVVAPMALGHFPLVSRAIIAGAAVLIVFYPAILAGHYCLFSEKGRSVFGDKGVPRLTRQEAVLTMISVAAAIAAVWAVLGGSPLQP